MLGQLITKEVTTSIAFEPVGRMVLAPKEIVACTSDLDAGSFVGATGGSRRPYGCLDVSGFAALRLAKMDRGITA